MMDDPQEQERQFWLHRLIHEDSCWVGRSADAMLVHAISGEEPNDWPMDGWDLGRCLITREVAPEHLREAMDKYIERAKPKVEGAFYGLLAAQEMVDTHLEDVKAVLKRPLFDGGLPAKVSFPMRWTESEIAASGARGEGKRPVSREAVKSRA